MPKSVKATTRKRIRGSYRRRIIDHLSDGPATVSGTSQAVGLRLPHASAELKRMRDEGLVHSDSSAGQRGAKQHLTATGWQLLIDDELARLQAIGIDDIPTGAVGRLLAKDGPQLLLAYTKSISSPLIPLPKSSDFSQMDDSSFSSGIQGGNGEWIWSVAREAEVRWYELETLNPVNLPNSDNSNSSLADWVESTTMIGLVRAKLLDPRQNMRLTIGSWFCEPEVDSWPDLPMPMGGSESWSLGIAHESAPPLQSQCPICAILPDRLSTTTLLAAASEGALVIAEASLLGRQGDALPLSILESWVARAHPRLSQTERKHRLQGLTQAIRKGRRKRSGIIRVEESTWRRFQADWSNHQWSDSSEVGNILLDVHGLSNTAWLSLIDWSLARQETTPVVLQYPIGHDDSKLLHSVFSDSRTRLAILSSEPETPLAYPTLRPDPIRPLSWYRLRLAGDVELPCQVTSRRPPSFTSPPPFWVSPNNAMELAESASTAREAAGDSAPPDATASSSSEMRIFAAVLRYPVGDVDWADRIESVDPLAAWIASPVENRWSLWRRQGPNLGADWIELLLPESIPFENLATVAGAAPIEWQDAAQSFLVEKIRHENDLALRLRTLVDSHSLDDAAATWLASTLLSQVAWLPKELVKELSSWAPSCLANHPAKNMVPALTGLNWLTAQGELGNEWVERLERTINPSNSMSGWLTLLGMVRDGRKANIEGVASILSLPIEWWAPFSPQLFNLLTESSEGRELLLREKISWAAALFREVGESHTVPGVGIIPHPGCSSELISRLERLLHGVDIESDLDGANGLHDILNAMKSVASHKPPMVGLSHPLIGWLLQPSDRWPKFSATEIIAGDPEVALLLAAGKSGFHPSLQEFTQKRL
ncbi:MAG: winged helix-turn-helix transcriptional regulator [Euryarchaeota archaeon]|nr:winged helix-turn-helix transcriptional regulator [Euryarchaeota archaeon]